MNKENLALGKRLSTTNPQRGGIPIPSNPLLPPSPITNYQNDSDVENKFFEEIIGSVFKTPDKPSAPVKHFDNLSPERMPLNSMTSAFNNAFSGFAKESGESSKDLIERFSSSPSNDEPLNTSFSKLLDIAGSGGGFSRMHGNFPDVDLNISWPNLPNI